ncbi:MAG TPA: long-chain-fatty-acid--CoA ligase [Acidimicrobiaceae bacterium]|nr:long-chain-fatty-acid--CoA ligase [Acidimicrobiaceae bacterium]
MAQPRCSSSCWSTETEADLRSDPSVFGVVVRTENGLNRRGDRAANLPRWSAVNLATLFADHPAERTAIVTGGDRITYGQLSAEVEKTRGVLVSLGLEPGDRVAILCATNFRFVRAWFGILGAGMVAVPLNPQSPAPEIERELAQVGAKAVIAGPAGIGVLEQVDRSVVPTLKHVLRPSGVGLPDSVDLDVLRETVEPAPMVERAEGDLACLMFTSGTAGAPKAAMLTHGNLAANLRQNMATSGKVVRPDDVGLCVLPLFHIMGLNSILNLSLYAGATLVLQERFDPMTVFETIADEQISVLVGPPTMWAALSQVDLVADDALKTVRIAVSGAATLPNRVVEEVAGRFGVRILEGYGLTEAAPGVTRATDDDTPIGSIGRPMAGMEVRIVDAAGDDVYIGDEGEILVRGDNVFVGYLDDPEATARAMDSQGWLHTGDIAVVDDDGFVYIVDRAKDLIIVSGFNVFRAEVERVLNAHPGVVESGVVGVPHPHTGESVKAFIVAEPGRVLEEDDLIEWCATELARYKCPTKIDLVDEIPRGLGGKIIRRELGA